MSHLINLFGLLFILGDDDSDKDKDYAPNLDEEPGSQDSSTESDGSPIKNPRKRLRRESNWKKKKAQNLRNCGKEYVSNHGKIHQARSVKDYTHICRFKCNENVPEEKRQDIFQQYWDLGSWDLQTSFINSCVEKIFPKRPNPKALKNKKSSTILKLQGFRVCKEFFLRTLDISNKRYSNVVQKKRETNIALTDKRGRHTPSNKMSESQIKFVLQHIRSFPKFKSHYSRAQNPNRRYLTISLNLKKMYQLYTEKCSEAKRPPVRLSYYRMLFNTRFNLSFHKPYSDTCNTCDKLNNIIKHSDQEQDIQDAVEKKKNHLTKAEAARNNKNKILEIADTSRNRVAIVFDLQKTLPTPLLTCSKVYYLRQLWTYNLCVHNLATKQATMFMWSECEASRGSQDIMSCLLKFIQGLPANINHIDAYSDNCGGQNKSKFVVKFWSYIVTNTNIKSVDHKFFIPGHSYSECDQDFSVIENAKKNATHVFLPEDWHKIVAKASRKFMVVQMNRNDFKAITPMDQFMQDKVKGISKMQWLHFERESPFILFYKNDVSDDVFYPFKEMNLANETSRPWRSLQVELPLLYQQPPMIKYKKYKDLIDLLQFIPPVNHAFYQNLAHENPPTTTKSRRQNKKQEDAEVTDDEEEEIQSRSILESDYDD